MEEGARGVEKFPVALGHCLDTGNLSPEPCVCSIEALEIEGE